MKRIIILMLIGLFIFIKPINIKPSVKIHIKKPKLIHFKKVCDVKVTAYNPGDPNQCFGESYEDWITGAWSEEIKNGDIAISRDLLGKVKNKDYVCLKFTNGIRCGIVKDKMNKRHEKRVDLAIRDSNLKIAKNKASSFGVKEAELFVMRKGIKK